LLSPSSGLTNVSEVLAASIIRAVILIMDAGRTPETLVNFYQTTRRYNPEDSHLRTHRRENLKSYFMLYQVTCLDVSEVNTSVIELALLITNYIEFLMLVVWVVTPCGLVDRRRYQCFGGTYCPIFRAEDGGSIFLRNVGIYLQVHTVLQPRRPTSTSLPP
jgi:hypothetical protein